MKFLLLLLLTTSAFAQRINTLPGDCVKLTGGDCIFENELSSLTGIDSNIQDQIDDSASESDLTTHEADVSTHGASASLVGTVETQTLTNKTINADSNTITNIENADIKASAAIDASKLVDGTVSSTELQYINSLSSNAQTQIDAKVTGPASSVNSEIALFNSTTGKLIKAATGTGYVKATSGVYSTSSTVGVTDITGTLPIANGGTGITSAGTSGNVLTSNGTAWVSSTAPSKIIPVTAVTTTYTALSTDELVTGSASSGAFTITLPTAVGITGKTYRLKKIDSSANIVTIDGAGSETIDGATTYLLYDQYQSITIVSDGANWSIQSFLPTAPRFPGTSKIIHFKYRTTAACTAGTCAGQVQGNTLTTTSGTFNSTGDYSIAIPSGKCAATPFCEGGIRAFVSHNNKCSIITTSSTALGVVCANNAGTNVNEGFQVSCTCESP